MSLSPEHQALITGSAISEEVAEERGYQTIMSKAELEPFGFGRSQLLVPTLLVPVLPPSGGKTYQHRPDHPRPNRKKPGSFIKYETPFGSETRLDVHPRSRPLMRDPSVPAIVTEGVRKGDAAASAGLFAIALAGVWNYRGHALADWDEITTKDRDFYVTFDSDVMEKIEVFGAMKANGAFLSNRGGRVSYIYLPCGPHGEKVGLDDYLAAGHDVASLFALATSGLRQPEHLKPKDGRAQIVVNRRPMHEVTGDAWAALSSTNTPTRLGINADRIVRIDGARFVSVTQPEMRHELDRAADWRRWERMDLVEASPPPLHIVDDVLATPSPPLPVLRGIVRHPFAGRDGQLVTSEGYDSASGLLVHLPESLQGIRVPAVPTERDLQHSCEWLTEPFVDFPFAEPADAVNAIGHMLTPFLRPYTNSITPLAVITATVRGSGKTTLAKVISLPSEGDGVPTMAIPRDESALSRKLFAALLSGQSTILLDNVTGKLNSPVLEEFLTTDAKTDRLLGGDRMGTVPQRANWILTGNAFEAGGDLPRRIVPIRLLPDQELPELRTTWRHPDLLRWMSQHRREVVTAVLTVIQGWLAKGAPDGAARMASYDPWARSISGVLETAGLGGFLSNRVSAIPVFDKDQEALRDFVDAWHDTYMAEPVPTGKLFELFDAMDEKPFFVKGNDDRARRTSFGMRIGTLQDRVVKRFRIVAAGKDGATRSKLWALHVMPGIEHQGFEGSGFPDLGSEETTAPFESTGPDEAEPSKPSEPFFYSSHKREGVESRGTSVSTYGDGAEKGSGVPQAPICTCGPCPANAGGTCNCGRYWKDGQRLRCWHEREPANPGGAS